jgi:hypothetical protein
MVSSHNGVASINPERQMRQKEKLWIEPSHRYDAHQFPEVSDDFRLADGRPLWYALLNDPNVLVMEAAEANRARAKLRELFTIEPDSVRECIGGFIEEVRKTLRSIPE